MDGPKVRSWHKADMPRSAGRCPLFGGWNGLDL